MVPLTQTGTAASLYCVTLQCSSHLLALKQKVGSSMTISYEGRFGKLLFRWKASLWKTIWKQLFVFLLLYYIIAAVYRFGLQNSPEKKNNFAELVLYLDETTSTSIPISFLLGLYVVTIVKRWWEQFENIAWPDNFLYLVSAFFVGHDEQTKIIRRNIARQSVLAAVLAWRNVSSRVLKRFPTAEHLTKIGLMTVEEYNIYKHTNAPFGRWFLPINWIQSKIIEAKQAKQLETSQTNQLLLALHAYKDKFMRLFVFDWVSIPLVYTQVCTVATYGYFAMCLIGRQQVEEDIPGRKHHINTYFPIFTVMEFLFYMGWLTVAEHLMHPFGEEDDDFELNYILDRHLYVAFMIADELHGQVPAKSMRDKDAFWGIEPWLPHTKASEQIKERKPHSHFGQTIPFQEMELVRSVSTDPSIAMDKQKNT